MKTRGIERGEKKMKKYIFFEETPDNAEPIFEIECTTKKEAINTFMEEFGYSIIEEGDIQKGS